MPPKGTGAIESPVDPRTAKHEELVALGAPLVQGGVDYSPTDIDDQHTVGICTGISLVQNRNKANGKKYSPDFQYLLQKLYYDLNWTEGSSIFSALRVGKNFGFLPAELWTHTTEADRVLPYSMYIAKLQAIPAAEVQRLIALCVDKIPGYAQVNVSDPQFIASAINASEAGILCMYRIGKEWYTPSWLPKDIDPLKPPKVVISGHAIVMSKFDYEIGHMQVLANTWGATWDKGGTADINQDEYKMVEAWSILKTAPPVPPYVFTKDLWFGMTDPDVVQLQIRLGVSPTSTHFGPLTREAVIAYQGMHGLPTTGYVGPLTRAVLNKI